MGLVDDLRDAYDKMKTEAGKPPPPEAKQYADYFRSGQMTTDEIKAGAKAVKNGADKVKDLMGFQGGGIVLLHKAGKPPIKFHAGGEHESTGTPAGQPIPAAKKAEAAAGKLGPLAQKQENFRRNVLTGAAEGALVHPRNQIKPPGRDEPVLNDFNVGPRYGRSMDLPNYDPHDPTPPEEAGQADVPPKPYDRGKDVQKAKGGAIVAKAKEGSAAEEKTESKAEEAKEDKGLKKAAKGAVVGKGKGKVGMGQRGAGRPPMPMVQQPSANLLSQGFNQTGMY